MKIVMRAAALFLFVAVLTTGCSSFNRAWRNPPPQSTGLAGRWEGRWQSAHTRHNGRLRAIMRPRTAERYDARFHATHGSVLSAEYGVTFDAKQCGLRSEFRGAADLGIWGRYETAGYAIATRLHATYRSKFDYGTFEMRRVGE